jgi:hypothetical protein
MHLFVLLVACLLATIADVEAFVPLNAANARFSASRRAPIAVLSMVMDDSMTSRLENIRRSYAALTERLGDPDVIADSTLLRKVMSDRAESEDVVNTYEEYRTLQEELHGATELFQEAGDDVDMKEMARQEIKSIEPQLEELEDKIKILLLPKDPNDDRNVVRACYHATRSCPGQYDHPKSYLCAKHDD